jgi:hypothetical protein
MIISDYFLVVDNIKSLFNIESDVFKFLLKDYALAKKVKIKRDDFEKKISEKIEGLIASRKRVTNKRIYTNSSRIKKLNYNSQNLELNLKEDIDLLIFDLVRLYDLIIDMKSPFIELYPSSAKSP